MAALTSWHPFLKSPGERGKRRDPLEKEAWTLKQLPQWREVFGLNAAAAAAEFQKQQLPIQVSLSPRERGPAEQLNQYILESSAEIPFFSNFHSCVAPPARLNKKGRIPLISPRSKTFAVVRPTEQKKRTLVSRKKTSPSKEKIFLWKAVQPILHVLPCSAQRPPSHFEISQGLLSLSPWLASLKND